jgi:hypothetical protein
MSYQQTKTQQTWKKKMSERAAKIRSGMHKDFKKNFSQMNAWLDSEETKKQYKIGWIDWVNCVVEVEKKEK